MPNAKNTQETQDTQNTQLVTLLQQLMAFAGAQTGQAIKKAIDDLVAAENVDIADLQAKIKTIQKILDADPSTPEFDQAQNIITSLNNILSRLSAAENTITKLEGDKTVAGSVDFKVAAEKARALAAEQTNATNIETNAKNLATHIDAYNKKVSSITSNLKANADSIAANSKAITDEVARATAAENAINSAIDAIQKATGASDAQLAEITNLVESIVNSSGLNKDGTFAVENPTTDKAGLYEYIHDLSADGADRANNLRNAIRKLAKNAKAADQAIDARLNILEGDAKTEGSILNIVTTAVANEQARAKAAEDALNDRIDKNEKNTAASITDLQAQIDNLSGGDKGSMKSVHDEVAATQTGAGLEKDGSYVPDDKTNYIKSATSLKDADKKLDAAVKGLEDKKADKSEVLSLNDIANIDTSALGNVFLNALNCGLSGGKNCGNPNKTATNNSKSGDGAVL